MTSQRKLYIVGICSTVEKTSKEIFSQDYCSPKWDSTAGIELGSGLTVKLGGASVMVHGLWLVGRAWGIWCSSAYIIIIYSSNSYRNKILFKKFIKPIFGTKFLEKPKYILKALK